MTVELARLLLGLLIGPGWAMLGGVILSAPAVYHHEYMALPFYAALGLAAGVGIGAVSVAVPTSGAIPQLLGAAIFGVGGAAAGIAAGRALECAFCDGLPKDELCIYEDAVRQGRFVLIAFTDAAHNAGAVRRVMARSGAASLDAARRRWRFGWLPADEVTCLSNEQVSEARRLLRGKKPLAKHKAV